MAKKERPESTSESPRFRLLRQAMQAVEKQFGVGAIMRLGEQPTPRPIAVISTGCLGIDTALGIGGLPRGRIIEIFGPEASGKTTLALQAIAQMHARGGACAFIDAEHALDVHYAQRLGVAADQLLVAQPDHGEQGLEICETLVRSGAVDLVVIDSVAALVPRAEIEGDMGDAHMGLQARLMSQALRKLTAIVHRTGCTLIFINQLRQKIGVVFGNPEVTTGGNALKFYASVRLEVRRIGPIKSGASQGSAAGSSIVGNRTRVKVVKNKLAPPFQQVEVDILYGRGIWAAGDLLDRGLESGTLVRHGAWIHWGERRLGQGRERAGAALDANPELEKELRTAIQTLDVSNSGPDRNSEASAVGEKSPAPPAA